VGVQPFGGEGLSGTGPKAGGPLYLLRLLSTCPRDGMRTALSLTAGAGTEVETDARRALLAPFDALTDWARKQSTAAQSANLAALCERLAAASATGATLTLPGPTGERNTYTLLPREAVLCVAADPADWLRQLAAVLAVGSEAVVQENPAIEAVLRGLPAAVQSRVRVVAGLDGAAFDAVLHHGDSDHLRSICEGLARRAGPIVGVQGLPRGGEGLALERLLIERSLSVNTAAAGGNASLMTIG
jgi:RHH-type proline utilization regulon transcriptional repressor/proline dehydrogenase/delta 1-pyrroline-5-carboxylate dehydrogenase